MSDAPYYGPVDESSSDIFLEKTFLISGYLTALGYGAHPCVVFSIQPLKSSFLFQASSSSFTAPASKSFGQNEPDSPSSLLPTLRCYAA